MSTVQRQASEMCGAVQGAAAPQHQCHRAQLRTHVQLVVAGLHVNATMERKGRYTLDSEGIILHPNQPVSPQ